MLRRYCYIYPQHRSAIAWLFSRNAFKWHYSSSTLHSLMYPFIMRPSSLAGGRILRRTLSVCLSVCLSVRPVSGCTLFTVAPSYERTSKIEKLRFSLMGQRHVCILFGTRRGPHIVRPSRPHKFLLIITMTERITYIERHAEYIKQENEQQMNVNCLYNIRTKQLIS